jgi:hypothetical protein
MSGSAHLGMASRKTQAFEGLFVLFLCVAVFGWGLHSKLSLYDALPTAEHSVPLAKLLSEQERPSCVQVERQLKNHAPRQDFFALFALLIDRSLAEPIAKRVRDRQDQADAPPVAFSFSGPSQLRPPPVQAA